MPLGGARLCTLQIYNTYWQENLFSNRFKLAKVMKEIDGVGSFKTSVNTPYY